MIRVGRPDPAPADVLAALSTRSPKTGLTELQAARKYYSKKQRPKKAYPFSRYKEYEVCLALDRMFGRKCAYCESKYEAVAARDVEHYRPKGAIDNAPRHPGYWWLAAEWQNLLPSCPACNQRRRHIEYRQGMTLEQIEIAERTRPSQVFGKGNSFPVSGNYWAMSARADLSREDPLLINPCTRDPQAHLEWVFEYDRAHSIWDAVPIYPLLRARRTQAGQDDPYAAASIAIYGLNRLGVFRSRMEHIRILQKSCQTFATTFIALAKPHDETSPDALALRANYESSHHAMSEFMLPHAIYAGMSRAFIAEVRATLTGLARGAA